VNTFLTPNWVTKEVARFWKNELVFGRLVNRGLDSQYMQAGAKVGYTVNYRLPQRFVPVEGQQLVQQSILNQTTPITITHQKHVGFGWSTADATMVVEDARKRYIMPAAIALANVVDVDGFNTVWPAVYNSIGAPGVPNTASLTYLQAQAILTNGGVPRPYCIVVDPMSMVQIVNTGLTYFNPQKEKSEDYVRGKFAGDALGIDDWYQSVNVASYTTGTFTASTPLVNGAGQTGSTISTDGWASGATSLVAGDSFTIAGVYQVNPISYVNTGVLQKFTVTANTSDSAGAIAALPISPQIITSGPLQTVSNAPADNAVITVVGATSASSGTLAATLTKQSLAFNEDAFVLVMADLEKDLAGAEAERIRSEVSNFSIRWTQQYNIQTDQQPSRLDIIYGWAAPLPYFALRLYS
jgi:hypothetical protein